MSLTVLMAYFLAVRTSRNIAKRALFGFEQLRFAQTDSESAVVKEIPEGLSREEYNRRFATYEKELHKFRQKVKKDIAIKKMEEKKLAQTDKEASMATLKEKQKKEKKELKQLKAIKRKELHERTRISKERKEASFNKEAIRRDILRKAQDDRYAELLQQSRTWVTADTLDDRIEVALDHSTTLY